jgi:F-type H+-transporting ATPase subunit delta
VRETTVARVYADTLLEVARERGQLDRIAEEVEALGRAFGESPRLRQFLRSPSVTPEDKKAALGSALQGRFSAETQRFLELVVERRRQGLLETIFTEFGARVAELRRQQPVAVVSAAPLSEALRERLRETLARATGREIVLEERVDPGLLGGLVVQLGDRRIDGSLRTRLDTLRERMRRGTRAGAAAAAAAS